MTIAIDDVPFGLGGCQASNFDVSNIVSEKPGRLRRFTSSPLITCGSPGAGKQLTGFFTTYDSSAMNPDDLMLFITFDDNLAYTGILLP